MNLYTLWFAHRPAPGELNFEYKEGTFSSKIEAKKYGKSLERDGYWFRGIVPNQKVQL